MTKDEIRKQIITAALIKFGSAPILHREFVDFRNKLCHELQVSTAIDLNGGTTHGLHLDYNPEYVAANTPQEGYMQFTKKALDLLK